MEQNQTYVAFLRGINVGGNHKVPMADLKTAFHQLSFKNSITLLNTGNVIFETHLEVHPLKIAQHLEKTFGFAIPVVVKPAKTIFNLLKEHPFQIEPNNKNIKYYVSFLWENANSELTLPWKSADASFEILALSNQIIFSVLDLSKGKSTKAMRVLEQEFGPKMTTRNWNTIVKIANKLN